MSPYFSDNLVTLHHGDCRTVLAGLPAQSVNCCVTSPPYWGLRDYGHDEQIGLKSTPEQYVAAMVGVFREVRRVLRDDGTLWLNLGDSYAGGGRGGNPAEPAFRKQATNAGSLVAPSEIPSSLKPKDLVGTPWLVAFALRADGWYLRQDIIWHKPNPMPESVTDRCTKAHEYIFLLSKSERYYYDQDAISEPLAISTLNDRRLGTTGTGRERYSDDGMGSCPSGFTGGNADGRNRRSVWTVTTKPYSGAHFATFPPDLIEPCIRAGCPAGGVVLDPFFGAGTTGLVCREQLVRCIGIELNESYCEIARKRMSQPMLFGPAEMAVPA